MAEITEDELKEKALSPQKTRTMEGAVEERSVDELIKADRYNQSKSTAHKVPWGMSIARTEPSGINGRN